MKRGAFLAELHRGVLDKRHRLDRDETLIGRDEDVHIRVDDRSVSRKHAGIYRRGERYFIRDLGSRNGITVNEQHIRDGAERELRVNDCIFLGKAVLCFLIADDKLSISSEVHADDLTGVTNRRGFLERLGQEIASARQDHRPLGLLLVGIDDLEGINRRFGQEGGNTVLKHAGQVLTSSLQPRESVGRYRGAVFGVIAPDLLDGLLLDRAQQLRSRLEEQPATHGSDLIVVGASVGVTAMAALDQDKLLAAADAALSHAKQRGSSVERASRDPDQVTEKFQRRMVPEAQFLRWMRPPAVGFSVRWEAPGAARSRQTPYDFELQSAVQQNLSGDELATYPNMGGCVVITLPHADGDRVPRLCEAIRGTFDQSLVTRGAPPAQLRFGTASLVETAQHALALARRF